MKKERKHLSRILSVMLATVILLISLPTAVIGSEVDAGQMDADSDASLVRDNGTLEKRTFEEDESLRDEFSKHYVLESGERFAVIFPEAVHYEDGGEWKEVDNRLSYKNGKYVSANPKFTASFAESSDSSELVSISDGDYTVSWGISFGKNVGGSSVKVQASSSPAAVRNGEDVSEKLSALKSAGERGAASADVMGAVSASDETAYKNTVTDLGKAVSGISYANAMDGAVSLSYAVSHRKVEEDIILRSRSDFASYTLNVNTGGLTVAAESDGRVTFKNAEGETVFIIEAPWMKDSAYGFSKDIEVTVAQTGNTAAITYTPSAEWLSSPDREYPVLIDPSFTTRDFTSNYVDTHMLMGEKDYTRYADSQTLYTGPSPMGDWTSYIRILNIPNISELFFNRITSASLLPSVLLIGGRIWLVILLTWAFYIGCATMI